MAEENNTNKFVIDKKLLSDALGGVEVIKFTSSPAVAEGEHYLSTLLRVNVTFCKINENSEETKTIIIKTYPNSVLGDFIKDCNLLSKEIITYHCILPKMSEIIGRYLTPDKLGKMKKDFLILEDLKLKNYGMVNRIERLDFEQCEAALKTLADFHSGSYLLHKKSPEYFDEIKKETLYTDDNIYMKSYVVNNFKAVANEFANVEHLKKYSEKLRLAGEKMWKQVQIAIKPLSNEINVFNHGDYWTTNLLFKFDENIKNKIQDIKLVDFQFCRWSSPAFDLQLLFNTSIRDRKNLPKFIEIYLNRLNKKIFPDVLSSEMLENALRRLDCFGLITAVCAMPICLLDSKNPLKFGKVTKEDFEEDFPVDNPYAFGCRDPLFQNVIPEYIDFYVEKGLL